MTNLRFEVMANYLSREQLKKNWTRNPDSHHEGCFVRKGPAEYATYPPTLANSGSELAIAIAAIKPQVSVLELIFLHRT